MYYFKYFIESNIVVSEYSYKKAGSSFQNDDDDDVDGVDKGEK